MLPAARATLAPGAGSSRPSERVLRVASRAMAPLAFNTAPASMSMAPRRVSGAAPREMAAAAEPARRTNAPPASVSMGRTLALALPEPSNTLPVCTVIWSVAAINNSGSARAWSAELATRTSLATALMRVLSPSVRRVPPINTLPWMRDSAAASSCRNEPSTPAWPLRDTMAILLPLKSTSATRAVAVAGAVLKLPSMRSAFTAATCKAPASAGRAGALRRCSCAWRAKKSALVSV